MTTLYGPPAPRGQHTIPRGYTLDDRAEALRMFAELHDDRLFQMDLASVHLPKPERDEQERRFTDGYLAVIAEYADPGLSRSDIALYFYDLRDAVNALTRFETGHGWDGDDDPERYGYTDETVATVLHTDIDNCLWPLLFGMSPGNVCFWCSRHKNRVTSWGAREPGRASCSECRDQRR